jgi:hypothetical protein
MRMAVVFLGRVAVRQNWSGQAAVNRLEQARLAAVWDGAIGSMRMAAVLGRVAVRQNWSGQAAVNRLEPARLAAVWDSAVGRVAVSQTLSGPAAVNRQESTLVLLVRMAAVQLRREGRVGRAVGHGSHPIPSMPGWPQPPSLFSRGSIGGIESTLARPGTKLEHTAGETRFWRRRPTISLLQAATNNLVSAAGLPSMPGWPQPPSLLSPPPIGQPVQGV